MALLKDSEMFICVGCAGLLELALEMFSGMLERLECEQISLSVVYMFSKSLLLPLHLILFINSFSSTLLLTSRYCEVAIESMAHLHTIMNVKTELGGGACASYT